MRIGRWVLMVAGVALLAAAPSLRAQNPTIPGQPWPVHSMDRPRPPEVNPGLERSPAPAPSDAIVLFDGRSLASWQAGDSTAAKWAVRNGYVEVVPGTGTMSTRRGFGDVQLHIEWLAPPPVGEGQERGNSGVFLMGRYEVQVLDSYHNVTYADGQASAIYGQYPPLANATRPPGRWNVYDIVFHRPRFNADGSLLAAARMTVFHNGVLVQDNVSLFGGTVHMALPSYTLHPDRLPISLQDHGNRMRFRNIWVRDLER